MGAPKKILKGLFYRNTVEFIKINFSILTIKFMTKLKLLIIALFAFLLTVPLSVYAFEAKTGSFVYVGEEEIIDGNLFAGGTTITVDGTIKGDVICAGQSININGIVEGDVICAGQSININGDVAGNVRVAAESVTIRGAVSRNVMAFGTGVLLDKGSSVGWDMIVGAAVGEIRGKIGRDLHGGAADVIIAGEIGRNVELKIDKQKSDKTGLTIDSGAQIGGSVIYTDKNEASISQGAVVAGEITHNLPKIKQKKFIAMNWAWGRLYSIFSALVIGLVLISLWGKEIKKLTDKMLDKPGASIGWGVVVMFLAPIISILLLITFIGIPLAFLLMGVWLIALFVSKILVGILIGRNIVAKTWSKQKDSMIWAMVVGIVVCWFIFSIPFIGWMFSLVALWWGLGGIWLYFRKA